MTGSNSQLANWASSAPKNDGSDDICERGRTQNNGTLEEFPVEHPILTRAEVIQEMKHHVLLYCAEYNKVNAKAAVKRKEKLKHKGKASVDEDGEYPLQITTIEDFFSDQYIAPCFWSPRKAEFGGSRWLEDALFIFAQCRNFDFEAASKRFFNFNRAAFPTQLVSFDEIPDDVAYVMEKAACFSLSPTVNSLGNPVVYLSCKNFSWKDIPLAAAKRAHIWLFWQWTSYWGPHVAQTRGINFVVSMKGMNKDQLNMEFESWCNSIIVGCLPVRTASFQLAYEPFWFGMILWPLVKHALSSTMRDRVVWLGTKEKHVRKNFLKFNYPELLHDEMESPSPINSRESEASSSSSSSTSSTSSANSSRCNSSFSSLADLDHTLGDKDKLSHPHCNPTSPSPSAIAASIPSQLGGSLTLDQATSSVFWARGKWAPSSEVLPQSIQESLMAVYLAS